MIDQLGRETVETTRLLDTLLAHPTRQSGAELVKALGQFLAKSLSLRFALDAAIADRLDQRLQPVALPCTDHAKRIGKRLGHPIQPAGQFFPSLARRGIGFIAQTPDTRGYGTVQFRESTAELFYLRA